MDKYDFSGWATRNNLKCSDGRTIMKDAFKHCDGETVSLVWNHQYNDPTNVLGHALLENREEGVYAYCSFNDTENGQLAKVLVQHGDISSLSICATQLKMQGGLVQHGTIREVSLVHAGANPGARIENIIRHSADGEPEVLDDALQICTGEPISLYHADEGTSGSTDKKDSGEDETVGDVLDTLNEKQQSVVYGLLGKLLEEKEDNGNDDDDDSEGGNTDMKHNVFDQDQQQEQNMLTHSDQEKIIALAKTSGVGSLQDAIKMYVSDNETLSHGFEQIEKLFPDFKDVYPGAPELLQRDLGWVGTVMKKTHKSPISRIRTRQADARIAELRAKGYQNKGDQKTLSGNIKLLSRTTDPQTVYRKDALNRDDIIDITDFDVVNYQWNVMKDNLNEDLALAIMIGDGREDGDPDKIHETHIRSIWNDEELYTIHRDVNIEAARAELQGIDTSKHFGENYIYAEAIITQALYAREKYKGSGTPDLFCTPHLLNVMLLARDLNGRRIYDSKSDLAAALNVGEIYTAEQFEGKIRTASDGKQKKLLGLFVNLADYQIGSTKGGEITKFDQFDIDFNQYKYLIETRLSGALTRVYSAIALEEPVATTGAAG